MEPNLARAQREPLIASEPLAKRTKHVDNVVQGHRSIIPLWQSNFAGRSYVS